MPDERKAFYLLETGAIRAKRVKGLHTDDEKGKHKKGDPKRSKDTWPVGHDVAPYLQKHSSRRGYLMARPPHDPNVLLRKRLVEIVTCQLRASLDGNPRPTAEVLGEMDDVIADDFAARLQDAISEIRLNDE